jgi:hypothetical protein
MAGYLAFCRVRAAFLAAAERPAVPLVRAAFLAAEDRSAALRFLAAERPCFDRAFFEAAEVLSFFSAFLRAAERF